MRYLPHTSQNVEAMLKVIGVTSLDELFESIPKAHRLKDPLDLPSSINEMELREHLKTIANRNEAQNYTQFLGAGCYRHYIPSIVNYLSSQGGFLTSYTPYQPEISQGTLKTIFEFQTMISRLTGMEVANACMYDGPTALAEACLMAKRLHPAKQKILIPKNLHPEYRAICETYLETQDVELISLEYDSQLGTISLKELQEKIDGSTLAVLVQSPNFFGGIEDLAQIQKIISVHKALFIVCVAEPLSLALLKSPGETRADIVVGEAQSFGNPSSFGGPHVGFFATRMAYVRAIPGRIVGETLDEQGTRCYTLTLSTREQHIRREKATSNICTNEALLATRATIYLSTLGEQGLKKLALWNHSLANKLLQTLKGKASLKFNSPFFNEFVLEFKKPVLEIEEQFEKQKILGGTSLGKYFPELKNSLLVCTTELNTQDQIQKFCDAL